jgi:hypothetical protein
LESLSDDDEEDEDTLLRHRSQMDEDDEEEEEEEFILDGTVGEEEYAELASHHKHNPRTILMI